MYEILFATAALATIGSFVIDLAELIQKYMRKDDAGLNSKKG